MQEIAIFQDQEASLSAAFVRFLESESKPKPQVPALTLSNSVRIFNETKKNSYLQLHSVEYR